MKRAILIFLVGCSAGATEPLGSTESPIIGGEAITDARYPWIAALLDASNGGSTFCTGSLVTRSYVLSAAHCFKDRADISGQPGRVKIVLGQANAASGGRLDVKRIVVHPAWKGFGTTDPDGMEEVNDIALVELAKPVTDVAPVALRLSAPSAGDDVTLTGYGVTSTDGRGTPGTLYRGVAKVRSVRPTLFLAGGQGSADSCRFDSGGPAMVESNGSARVVGVVSREWAGSTRKCGDGGVYTYAAAFQSWLEETTGETLSKAEETDAGNGATTTRPPADDAAAPPAPAKSDGCAVGALGDARPSGAALSFLGALAVVVARRRRARR